MIADPHPTHNTVPVGSPPSYETCALAIPDDHADEPALVAAPRIPPKLTNDTTPWGEDCSGDTDNPAVLTQLPYYAGPLSKAQRVSMITTSSSERRLRIEHNKRQLAVMGEAIDSMIGPLETEL